MIKIENISVNFQQGLNKLGFVVDDDALFLTNTIPDDENIVFHIYEAQKFEATAVYLRKQLNESYKPQVYIYDRTDVSFSEQQENELTEIQKKIWTSGETPLACVFYNTEIKILDCTKHITNDYKPEYLVKSLKLADKAHKLYNEQFAVKIKSGVFWEEEENKKKFKFQNSAYDKLIDNIRYVENKLIDELKIPKLLITKIIVQSILIKYLEERGALNTQYFHKYAKENSFSDILKNGKFTAFLDILNDKKDGLNGNVFKWEDTEKKQIEDEKLSILAELLSADKIDLGSKQLEIPFNWRYFEFKFIPVELISRLYEEFLGEDKQDNGLFYTPSHLAKLLVDECLPLKKYNDIDLTHFNTLDPACGSGIFLVLVFKRLVQIWKLQNWSKQLQELPLPSISELKRILKNIYGIDKEEQAVSLAAFSLSLALCDEVEPSERIINELKFDDLRKDNLIEHDFLTCDKIKDEKFDLVIGNPPFVRGSVSGFWNVDNKKINIPQGQIALKFLSESFPILKDKGLVCLIIKSSGLLYNSTSNNYKKALFENKNVVQVLDFTALARNKSLWDNGADVASAAAFVRNEKPDFTKNILHLTFRRTKATKERITFEIDDYDLHYVNRRTAIENEFIWKINLLGGGRIKTLVEKTKELPTFQKILKENNCVAGEGYIEGKKNKKLSPDFIYKLQTLPSNSISEIGINYDELENMNTSAKFVKVGDEKLFNAPNIIFWKNIGKHKLSVFYNEKSFSFKHQIFSVFSNNENNGILQNFVSEFKNNNDFYRFFMFSTSGYVLINRNTFLLKNDFMKLPFLLDKANTIFSQYDKNIISDVNLFMQDFVRSGENSVAVKQIKQKDFQNILRKYGTEFSKVLNLIYETDERKFRLSDVVTLKNSLIATVFKYDSENKEVKLLKDLSELNIENLTDNQISSELSVNRIIKLYPQKDTIVFVKPNQYRYWLSLIAYRDADACFADFADAGF